MKLLKSLPVLALTCFVVAGRMSASAQVLPIKPARTISFTTDEGSYMSVDISPDGKTLVFDLLGDLYMIPAEGGSATQLTRGLAIHMRPVWSPDGKKIACISDYSGIMHINILSADGKNRQVLNNPTDESLKGANSESEFSTIYRSCLVWLKGDSALAYRDSIYTLSGQTHRPVLKFKNIAYFSKNQQAYYDLDRDSKKLFRYDLNTHNKNVVDSLRGEFRGGIVSPDERWWCYVTDSNAHTSLILDDLHNHIKRILVDSLINKDPSHLASGYWPHFCFSPDSRFIYISYGGKIHLITIAEGTDNIIPFIVNVHADLGVYNYHTFKVGHEPFNVKYIRSASTSPDGKHLVFSALDRVYLMDLPNGKPHVLVHQPYGQFQPAWSPDSKWIAYVTWCDTTGGALWRAAVHGGRPEQLTSERGAYQRPAWSPDGNHIVIVHGAAKLYDDKDVEGNGNLEIVAVKSKTAEVLARDITLRNNLSFSANGSLINYEPKDRMRVGGSEFATLLTSDLKARDSLVLATRSGGASREIWQNVISPDGRYLVFSRAEDLFLVRRTGGTQKTLYCDPKPGNLPAICFAHGVDPHWENGGKTLAWNYGNCFYRIDPDKIAQTADGLQPPSSKGPFDDPAVQVHIEPTQTTQVHLTTASNYAKGLIALTNARVITMKGEQVIENGTVLIRDGRFAAVSTRSMALPKGAKVINVSGKTIMPGLVDLHLHMKAPSDLFPQQSWLYLINLAYGVTTARDPSSTIDSYGYTELLKSGQMTGPRLFSSGRSLSDKTPIYNFENALSMVRKRALLGGEFIKNYAPPTRLKREWILLASEQAGLNMTNEGFYSTILQLGEIKDGSTGVEHNPDWGDVYKDVTTFYAKSGIYFTPTLEARPGSGPYMDKMFWHHPDGKLLHFMPEEWLRHVVNAKPDDTTGAGFRYASSIDARIRHMGGRVTFGSHGDDEGVGVHNELWSLQAGGLSNMETLQAATIMGAEALGIQKDVGSIEVGKIADLIILNSNPLDDIHNSHEIKYVMKDGILYDADTLDEIWPVKKKCEITRVETAGNN